MEESEFSLELKFMNFICVETLFSTFGISSLPLFTCCYLMHTHSPLSSSPFLETSSLSRTDSYWNSPPNHSSIWSKSEIPERRTRNPRQRIKRRVKILALNQRNLIPSRKFGNGSPLILKQNSNPRWVSVIY